MKFEFTQRADELLRVVAEYRLFEIYHTNSKLSAHQAAQPPIPTNVERYLTTRGFRQYKTAQTFPLPPALPAKEAIGDVLSRRRSRRDLSGPISFVELGTVLEQSLGCTAVIDDPEVNLAHAFRAWPSAGGVYPLDAYLLAQHVSGLIPALYHYNVIQNTLELLPSRPPQAILDDGYFHQYLTSATAAALFLVACFERTTTKYGERGYRLVMLDAGHAAQNILLSAEQLHIGAVAMGGFSDDSLASDLGIDGVSEAVVHTVLFGRAS